MLQIPQGATYLLLRSGATKLCAQIHKHGATEIYTKFTQRINYTCMALPKFQQRLNYAKRHTGSVLPILQSYFGGCAIELQRVFCKRYKSSLLRALPNDATNKYLKSRGLSYQTCEWLTMWRMAKMVAGSMMTFYKPLQDIWHARRCTSKKINSV
jgi:hypothetical protein